MEGIIPDPIRPIGFRFGIFADVPDPDPLNPNDWSYPDVSKQLWSWQTAEWSEVFVGYDRDPLSGLILDSTFQYNVVIPEPAWFYQPGENTILRLSIQAIYPNNDPPRPTDCWGWKTRAQYFGDRAVFNMAAISSNGFEKKPS